MIRFRSFGSDVVTLSLLLVLACQLGCQRQEKTHDERPLPAVKEPVSAPFTLRAEWFQPGAELPKVYTCDGLDASPGLTWTKSPVGTGSFVLIMEHVDPTIGARIHWIIYDIPATADRLLESRPRRNELLDGSRQGINDFGRFGYTGPCPPPGRTEHYTFNLYALDSKLGLKPGLAKRGLAGAMKGHVLAQAEITGVYSRETLGSPK